MRYLSVCSGIEAASVAWEPLGWVPVAFSEIEPLPCSVLKERYPHVPNLGDMTKFEEWDIEPGSIDVLVGGCPCQSFSIAGLRGGLTDDRGNLSLTFCRILERFKPRWFLFENVPGLLSSNGGRDFGSILGAMAELRYGFAWRVLNAEYFGIPQRRRRVFVVGCLGNARRAGQVLFNSGCVSRDSKKGRKTKQNVAALTATGVGTCGADDNQGQAGHLIAGTDFDLDGGLQVACTLSASDGGVSSGYHPIVAAMTSRQYADNASSETKLVVIPLDMRQCSRGEKFTNNRASGSGGPPGIGIGNEGDPSPTIGTSHFPVIAISTGDKSHCLNAGGMGRQDYETETMVVSSYRTAGDGDVYDSGDKTAALTTGTDPCANIVAFSGRNRGDDGRGYDRPPNVTGDIAGTVDTVKPGCVAGPAVGVRRLTVEECEKLQGFPSGWTDVLHRGKPASDGPRYKSIGNSMAVPVVAWIGSRIQMVENSTSLER